MMTNYAIFVKSLHIMQDFRNRAVHEGLRPEVRKDIEGIWTSAAKIYAEIFFYKQVHPGKSKNYQVRWITYIKFLYQ